jgi:hypothetical protein
MVEGGETVDVGEGVGVLGEATDVVGGKTTLDPPLLAGTTREFVSPDRRQHVAAALMAHPPRFAQKPA